MPAKRNIEPIKRIVKRQKYSIIIPAAGEGVRMKSYGVKSLIQLGKETIIQRQLRIIRHVFPNSEIIVISGFQSDRIIKETDNSIIHIENEQYNVSNVAKSIGMGLKAATTSRVLIVYGDLVFGETTLDVKLTKRSLIMIGFDLMTLYLKGALEYDT